MNSLTLPRVHIRQPPRLGDTHESACSRLRDPDCGNRFSDQLNAPRECDALPKDRGLIQLPPPS